MLLLGLTGCVTEFWVIGRGNVAASIAYPPYVSARSIRRRCYCTGLGPECHETKQRYFWQEAT